MSSTNPQSKARRRGGRKRNPHRKIDVLRTRIWVQAASLESQLSAGRLQVRFGSVRKEGGGTVSSHLWVRYARGRVVPADGDKKASAVEAVDRAFPGTAQWFRHPVWDYLKGRTKVTGDLVAKAERAILERIDVDAICRKKRIKHARSAQGRRAVDAEMVRVLSASVHCLNSLYLILLISSEGAFPDADRRRRIAWLAYLRVLPKAQSLPQIRPFAREFHELVEARVADRFMVKRRSLVRSEST